MNGIPHLSHLRSESIFGLSFVLLIFDDNSDNDWNRQKVLERLNQADLPDGLSPSMGTDWSPTGQIYWYTLNSTNPKIDLMDLKSIQDWTLVKEFKSVPEHRRRQHASAARRASIRSASTRTSSSPTG